VGVRWWAVVVFATDVDGVDVEVMNTIGTWHICSDDDDESKWGENMDNGIFPVLAAG
jgi:hypothetical protein